MDDPSDEPATSDGDGAVFVALADPSRRRLMDALFERDGQTLTELCDVLPTMTRFGVMKHLRVLAGAELVLTEKVGRRKHHYLNPVPIGRIHDRWIAKYAEAPVGALFELADDLEGTARDARTTTRQRDPHPSRSRAGVGGDHRS